MSRAGWKRYKLEDILSKTIDNRGKNPPFSDTGYSYIDTTCIVGDNRYPSYALVRKYVSKETYENWFRSGHPRRNDLLIATVGANIGKICLMDDTPACIAQNTIGLRIDVAVADPIFAYYVLSSNEIQSNLKSLDIGSAQPSIKVPHLLNLSVALPPLSTQSRIAAILSALDDKIELNRQINATLEAIAQAIFKEWFVDLNFPGATGEMVESELGMIPHGWWVEKLGEIVEVKGGTTPSTKEERFWNGENYWATPKDLSNLSSPILLTTERKITTEGAKQIGSGILPSGTLLLSSRAPIGYLAISDIPVSINQGFIAINAKATSNLFILHWLKENMETIIGRANGSTFLEISKTNFREIELVIPDTQITQMFEKVIAPIFEQIKVNMQESITLATLRDSLLPKLMNGEIDL